MEKREASALSKLVGAELAADQGRRKWKRAPIARQVDIDYKRFLRMLDGKAEISVANLIAICHAIGTNPRTILDEAERHAPGGSFSNVVSPAPSNVTSLHERDYDTYKGRMAADYDAEAETDEPDHP